jgi:hypothetical protein
MSEIKLNAAQEWRLLVASFRYPADERRAFVKYVADLLRGCLEITDERALVESRRRIARRR